MVKQTFSTANIVSKPPTQKPKIEFQNKLEKKLLYTQQEEQSAFWSMKVNNFCVASMNESAQAFILSIIRKR